MVTTWPKNFPGLGTGAQRIADNITNMSDGRLIVKLFNGEYTGIQVELDTCVSTWELTNAK